MLSFLRSWPDWLLALTCSVGVLAGCSSEQADSPPLSGAGGAGGANAGAPPADRGGRDAGGATASGGEAACGYSGQSRCNGAIRESCQNGTWKLEEDCGAEARCNAARNSCLSCSPGALHCRGEELEQCSLDGDAWETIRSCADGCVADGERAFCRLCEPDEVLCDSVLRVYPSQDMTTAEQTRAETQVLRCSSDGAGYTRVEVCAGELAVCDPEGGVCRVCAPSELTCDGATLRRCNRLGNGYENVEECQSAAACDAKRGECKTSTCEYQGAAFELGAVLCQGTVGTSLSICRDSGQWEVLDVCDDAASCAGGVPARRCLDAADGYCVPGATRCQGDVLQRCAAPGEAATAASYYDYVECAIACEARQDGSSGCRAASGGSAFLADTVCTPGEADYQTCTPTGCVEQSCGSGRVCLGSGAGCGQCVPGSYRCAGQRLLKCNAAGTKEDVAATCNGVCDAFWGECLPAAVGERYCDGSAHRVVGVNGKARTLAECGAAELCDAERGCLPGVCAVGSTACGGPDGLHVLTCQSGSGWVQAGPCAERCEPGLGCVTARRVTAGDSHTCVLLAPAGSETQGGTLYCWGGNEAGQLGDAAEVLADRSQAAPVRSRLFGSELAVKPIFLPSGLCAGKNFSCADVSTPSAASAVVCWGANDRGQLGLGRALSATATPYSAPTELVVKIGEQANAPTGTVTAYGLRGVTCGSDFACALDDVGKAYCWGANDFGQLGSGQVNATSSAAAVPVTGLSDLQKIVAGSHHACALDHSGKVYCWGDASKGQLGGPDTSSKYGTPQAVPKVTAEWLALGRDFTLTGSAAGVTAFGQNYFGQLGTGAVTAVDGPTIARAIATEGITGLSSGPQAAHACLTRGDTLECWGANPLGQLGDGSVEDQYQPISSPELRVRVAPGTIAIGKGHSCVIATTGEVTCWGGNRRKQLGPLLENAPTIANPSKAF